MTRIAWYERTMRSVLAVVGIVLLWSASASAAELRGRVVASDGTGVAGAVVFLRTPIPPLASPRKAAVMDQIDKQFVPRVLPIAVGTEVRFPNHDQIHHHVYSFSRVKTFDLPLSKGAEAPPVVFDQPGVVKVGCNIHDWMLGVILVVPSSVFTTTDDGGAFTLRDVPDGELSIGAWHEASETAIEAATQRLTIGATPPSELTFTLAVRPDKARPAVHGSRGNP